jgi:cellulose synthase/poly-beta-1,6-N-acetylglucosamine synthase-like glycosyltransferase
MWVFYFLSAIVIWLGLLSLRGGFRFAAYIKNQLAQPLSNFTPFASLLVPFRGVEPGLNDNLSELFKQKYPEYEIIFVTDSANDPALETVRSLIAEHSQQIPAQVISAGGAKDAGQKVHNLQAAVMQVSSRSEVFVFADSDARPGQNWLRALVSPLADENLGAATGYRWFLPEIGGFATQLRSIWNASIASALGENRKSNFCWGGSTAIRRETFARLKVRERWQGTVSDDFTLTRILGEAKLPIHFVPQCLVASKGDCSLSDLLEFSNRQLKITRVYAPHLWQPVLFGIALFCLVFFGGILLVLLRAAQGLSFGVPLAMLVVIFLLGAAKSWIRFQAVATVLRQRKRDAATLLGHLLLWPLASLLYLFNALVAAFSRRITWRGITYELKSPSVVAIIKAGQ